MKHFPIIILFFSIQAGCSAVPARFDVPYSDRNVPLANVIVQRIRCELAAMVQNKNEPVFNARETLIQYDYHVAMLLSLDATDTGGLAPSLTFPSSNFSFNITPSIKQSRQDTINYNLEYSMSNIYDEWKAHPESFQCPNPVTNLAGNLGLAEKVASSLLIADLAYSTTAKPTDGQFSGVVNFVATKSINQGGPTWTLKNFTGPGSGLLAASEVNTDKLSFGFAASPKIKLANKSKISIDPVAGFSSANQALGQAVTIDFGTQLTGIRNAVR